MESILCPVDFTQNAIHAVEQLRLQHNLNASMHLRIAVQTKGCSEKEFIVGFDSQLEGDDLFPVHSFHVLIHKSHTLHLFNIQLDYIDTGENQGFVFKHL